MAINRYDLVTVTLQGESGLPTDVYTTDWAFGVDTAEHPGLDAAIYAVIFDVAFFNLPTTGSSGRSIGNWIGHQVDRGVDVTVDLYNITAHLDGSPHGSPTSTGSFTLDAATTAGSSLLPSECAVAVSSHADLSGIVEVSGDTRPKARRRGRQYLGPFSNEACGHAGGGIFLDLDFQEDIVEVYTSFLDSQNASPSDFYWGVWSRVDAAVRPVVGGWLDNAWDTQRRRGEPANGRTNWP